MDKKFFRSNNINRLVKVMELLRKREPKSPGLGMAFGPAGMGKSEGMEWYFTNYDAFYVLPINERWYTYRWLLHDICRSIEPGVQFKKSKEDLFLQTAGLLRKYRLPLIIDEADYLVKLGFLEITKDLLNKTDVPIMLVGTEITYGAMSVDNQLWSRLLKSAIIDWQPLTAPELAMLFREWTGLSLSPGATEILCMARKGDFRDLESDFTALEIACNANKITEVPAPMAQKLIEKSVQRKEPASRQLEHRFKVIGREAAI